MKCLDNICIKKRVPSGKSPARVPIKSSAIGSTSHRGTWGTWSRKNLMKARLGCRSVRSVRWAVKKAPTQTEVMYDKYRVVVVISKSSFSPKEQKMRISRDYCRDDRPSSIYWVEGPVREHLVVRGRVNAVVEVGINE